jgi:hypothetical protein
LSEQDGDRACQDLPDVPVRNSMAHQRAQIFELRVRLAVGSELHAVVLGAQRLRSRQTQFDITAKEIGWLAAMVKDLIRLDRALLLFLGLAG